MSNSSWSYGPTPVPVAAPTPVKAPFLECDNCGEDIEEGDECVQLFIGRAGKGKKSGQPTVVDSMAMEPQHAVANLHLWCVAEFAVTVVYEDQNYEDEPQFCAACDAKLDGDSG